MSKEVRSGAVGGGFVRGAAHVRVLKVLEENNIKPHMVAGTSAGSMIASLYASGWSVSELENMVCALKPGVFIDEIAAVENFFIMTLKLFIDALRLPCPFRSPLGLMKGVNLTRLLRSMLGKNNFEGPPLLLCVTTD